MACLSEQGDERTHDDTQHQGVSQLSEFLFQSVSVYVQFAEARYLVQCLVEDDGQGHEALAERLGDGDALQLVVALELLGREVGAYQGDDVADDGGEIAPGQTLPHHEVDHGSYEGEVPVVP